MALLVEQQQEHGAPAAVAHPQPHRRLRVREVRSRFMSPVVSSSYSGDLHLPIPLSSSSSKTTTNSHSQERRRIEEAEETLSCADDTRIDLIMKMRRSLEAPPTPCPTNKQQQHMRSSSSSSSSSFVTVKRPPFNKENVPRCRPDTPTVTFHHRRSTTTPTSSAARKLLQLSVANSSDSEEETKPPSSISSSSRRSCDSWNGVVGDPSLTSYSYKHKQKPPPSLPLPKTITRKQPCSSDDVHSLRLLYNRYLQWRFANAKAHAAITSQIITAQTSLHALFTKISQLHHSVEKKHTTLAHLNKAHIMSTILQHQMPYLDEWSALEREYSSSISEAIKALQDASIRLPISGNVRASIGDIAGALNSASTVMNILFSLIQGFLPKGQEIDTLISELAEVVKKERALIQECGHLLTKTHILQVEECSLRGQLIQLKQSISSYQSRVN